MLSLQLRTGDYMTIGDEVVFNWTHLAGDRCKLMVKAPRDMTILRGEVLERTGGERPECVVDGPYRHRQEWNRNKSQALAAMRALLCEMDGEDSNVQSLRRQLDLIFPPESTSSEPVYSPK